MTGSAPSRVLIAGGGVTGLAAAYFLRHGGGEPLPFTLVEAAPRLGGKIETEHHGGFVVEVGPDSFITRKPAALELVRELGLDGRLCGTDPERRKVYVLHRGRLTPLPDGMTLLVPRRLGPVVASPMLSWRGKLRLALEPLVPARRAAGDESLGAFVRRRFGREVLERVAGPLLAGIYSADPERLSLDATFPRFAELERRHGSLLRAVRRARPSRLPSPTSARMTLEGGMEELVRALEARLRAAPPEEARVLSGRRITALRPRQDGGAGSGGDPPAWEATLDDGSTLHAGAVVLALPAAAAAPLLPPSARDLAAGLRRLETAPSATVTLGFAAAEVPHPLDGYGFLVPAAERRRITACTWSSTKFPHRAPPGSALLRVFVGGAQRPGLADLAEAELVSLAREELRDLLGVGAPPRLARVHRAPAGNPQYRVGHRRRVEELEAACPPGLILAGAAYHGVGLPDCIESGRRAAGRAAVCYPAQQLRLSR